jgi:putative ABC transport system ATP-binding protein
MTPSTTGTLGNAAPMIQLDGVHLNLQSAAGEVKVLRGVNLRVERGERIGIGGPSGSGKSTMVMIIAGLERASSGTVVIDGTDLNRMDEDALALFRRRRIGIVFQSFHLIPAMTALENVAVPLELARRADAFERAEEALRAVELGHRLGHYPAQLSGGEQQRVAMARAFAPEPELILADEPTGNLASETGTHVMDLLFALQVKSGATLMLITHDRALAARCSRRVRLLDGRIAGDGASPGGAT